jgi:CDP-4-dehydro-6-deoxyglucose reductase, E1
MIKLIKSSFYKEREVKSKLTNFIKKTKQLSFGKECEKFEENFCKWQNRKFCIFVNSGSSANLALVQSLLNLGKIKKGDKVGFSSVTWSTNAMPLVQLGLKPIPIDVELNTLNVSSRKLLDTVSKEKIKALFLTNLLGFCDDIDEIKKVCDKKKIILLEDNCESLGTIYKNRKLGNFGYASTFSFYVGHHMSTIEGGAICTDDKKLADMLKIVRAHGWDRNLSLEDQVKIRNRHKVNSTFYSRYTFYDLGYNLRPTEVSGFIGNQQIKYLDEIINKRSKNFLEIASIIYKNSKKYFPIMYKNINLLSNFAIPIICKSRKIRDELVELCKDKVEIRPIVGGDMMSQPFFKKYISFDSARKFKNSNARLIHERGLYFGNNPELSKQEIRVLINIFK